MLCEYVPFPSSLGHGMNISLLWQEQNIRKLGEMGHLNWGDAQSMPLHLRCPVCAGTLLKVLLLLWMLSCPHQPCQGQILRDLKAMPRRDSPTQKIVNLLPSTAENTRTSVTTLCTLTIVVLPIFTCSYISNWSTNTQFDPAMKLRLSIEASLWMNF